MSTTENKPRENQFISDEMEIYSIFKGLALKKEKLWVWQIGDNKRAVHYALVRKVDPIKKRIEIVPNNSSGFKFDKSKEFFLYCVSRGIALKIPIKEYDPLFIAFHTPARLNILSKDFLKNIELVEKENEENNKHKRSAQRIKSKSIQFVTLKKHTANNVSTHFFPLYDISAGGMGFLVEDPAEFEKGDEVEIESIDSKQLPKALKGKVVAVRLLEDDSNSFKVGVVFTKD